MKRTVGFLCLLALGLAASCGEDKTVAPPKSDYLEPTSPDNLVANLATAYRYRDIKEYAKLLAPEFTFRFQDADAQDIGTDTWNKDQDSTGTDALFRTPVVSEIRVDLSHHTAAAPPTETGFDPGTLWIRINPVFLDVDQTDGITWQVDGDVEDMFFRKGWALADEDTTRWFLLEWRDIPGGVFQSTALRYTPTATKPSTWGSIKNLYGEYAEFQTTSLRVSAIEPETWGGIKSKYELN